MVNGVARLVIYELKKGIRIVALIIIFGDNAFSEMKFFQFWKGEFGKKLQASLKTRFTPMNFV